MSTAAYLIFVKAPVVGEVKTRLGEEVGMAQACALYRFMVFSWLLSLEGVSAIQVYYSPAGEEDLMKEWLGEQDYRLQAEGDLGARLAAGVSQALAEGYERVWLMGGDCPGIDVELLEEANRALHAVDVVIGPSVDGGYYLLGVKKDYAALFEGIAWSTEKVLEQTVAAVQSLGLSYRLLGSLEDVDDLASWQRAQAEGLLE